MNRRNFIKTATIAGVALGYGRLAVADSYPDRPITVMVPLSAGGVTDIYTRTLMKVVSEILDVPVVIENKPGANGLVAAQSVAQAKPDGYTLCMTIAGVYRYPHMQNLDFNPLESLEHIAFTNDFDLIIVVDYDSPLKSLEDLIAKAKAADVPLLYGSPNPMSTQQIILSRLAEENDLALEAVAYKGDTESLTALMRGELEFSAAVGNISSYIKAKKLRIIGLLNEVRSKNQPDIPTITDLGYSISAASFMGLIGPKGIAPEHIQVLESAVQQAIDSPELAKIGKELGISPMFRNHADFTEYAKDAYEDGKRIAASLEAE